MYCSTMYTQYKEVALRTKTKYLPASHMLVDSTTRWYVLPVHSTSKRLFIIELRAADLHMGYNQLVSTTIQDLSHGPVNPS